MIAPLQVEEAPAEAPAAEPEGEAPAAEEGAAVEAPAEEGAAPEEGAPAEKEPMSEEEAATKIQARARGMGDRNKVETDKGYRNPNIGKEAAAGGGGRPWRGRRHVSRGGRRRRGLSLSLFWCLRWPTLNGALIRNVVAGESRCRSSRRRGCRRG